MDRIEDSKSESSIKTVELKPGAVLVKECDVDQSENKRQEKCSIIIKRDLHSPRLLRRNLINQKPNPQKVFVKLSSNSQANSSIKQLETSGKIFNLKKQKPESTSFVEDFFTVDKGNDKFYKEVCNVEIEASNADTKVNNITQPNSEEKNELKLVQPKKQIDNPKALSKNYVSTNKETKNTPPNKKRSYSPINVIVDEQVLKKQKTNNVILSKIDAKKKSVTGTCTQFAIKDDGLINASDKSNLLIKIKSLCQSDVEEIVKLHKYRHPKNIVIVTDDRDNFDFYLTGFNSRTQVYRIPGLSVESAFDDIKKHPSFGMGTIFVFSCGTHDLLQTVHLQECINFHCPTPVNILMLSCFTNAVHLIEKALVLNFDILYSTKSDIALFNGLIPVAINQFNEDSINSRRCHLDHPTKTLPILNPGLYNDYNSAIGWFNKFTIFHAQKLGYSPWNLEKSYFEAFKPLNKLLPNGYNLGQEEETIRANQVKLLCKALLLTSSSNYQIVSSLTSTNAGINSLHGAEKLKEKEYASRTLFVSQDYQIPVRLVKEYLRKFGKVLSCIFHKRSFKTFGFVTYSKASIADHVLQQEKHIIAGKYLHIERYATHKYTETEANMTANKSELNMAVKKRGSNLIVKVPTFNKIVNKEESRTTVNESQSNKIVNESQSNKIVNKPESDMIVNEAGFNMTVIATGCNMTVSEPESNFIVKEPGSNIIVNKEESRTTVNESQSNKIVNKPESNMIVNEPGFNMTVIATGCNMTVSEPESRMIVNETETSMTVNESQSNMIVSELDGLQEGKTNIELEEKEYASRTLIVNQDYRIPVRLVKKYLRKFGKVLSCIFHKRSFKTFGFVTYSKASIADHVLQQEKHVIDGKYLHIERYATYKYTETESKMTANEPEFNMTVKERGSNLIVKVPTFNIIINKEESRTTVNESQSNKIGNKPEPNMIVNEPGFNMTVIETGCNMAVNEPESSMTVNETETSMTVNESRSNMTVRELDGLQEGETNISESAPVELKKKDTFKTLTEAPVKSLTTAKPVSKNSFLVKDLKSESAPVELKKKDTFKKLKEAPVKSLTSTKPASKNSFLAKDLKVGNLQKSSSLQRNQATSYKRVTIISDRRYMPFLEHLKKPRVLVLADRQLETEDLKIYLEKKKEFLTENTLYLLVIGIHSVTKTVPFNGCSASCKTQLESLQSLDFSIKNLVLKLCGKLGNTVDHILPLLPGGSSFAILPPLSVSLISLNVPHQKLHDNKALFPDYIIANKNSLIEELYPVWIDDVLKFTLVTLTKYSNLCPSVCKQLDSKYRKLKVMECCINDQPNYYIWKEVATSIVDFALKQPESGSFEALNTNSNLKVGQSAIPELIKKSMSLINSQAKSHEIKHEVIYDHLVLIGHESLLNLLPNIDFCNFTKLKFNDLLDFENLSKEITCFQKQGFKKVLFMFISDGATFCSEEKNPECIFMKCNEPLYCTNIPSSRELIITKIKSTISLIRNIISGIGKLCAFQQKVIVVPFAPRTYFLVTNSLIKNFHNKMHEYLKCDLSSCFLRRNTKKCWEDSLQIFSNEWKILSLEVHHSRSAEYISKKKIIDDSPVNNFSPILWKDLSSDLPDIICDEMSGWKSCLISLAKHGWVKSPASSVLTADKPSSVIPNPTENQTVKRSTLHNKSNLVYINPKIVPKHASKDNLVQHTFHTTRPIAPQVSQVKLAPAPCHEAPVNIPPLPPSQERALHQGPVTQTTSNHIHNQKTKKTYKSVSQSLLPVTSLKVNAVNLVPDKEMDEISMLNRDLDDVSKFAKTILNSKEFRKISNTIFKKVFLVGRRELISPLSDFNIKSSLIYHDFNSFELRDVQIVLNKFGSFNESSVCCLAFDASIITDEVVVSSGCFKNTCSRPLFVYPLNTNLSPSIQAGLDNLIFNRLQTFTKFVVELSRQIPVIILPLIPTRVYCNNEAPLSEGVSETDGNLVHQLSHTVSNLGGFVVYGTPSFWKSVFESLTASWKILMAVNNKNYESCKIIDTYVSSNHNIFPILKNASNFSVHWTEEDIWKAITEIVTVTLLLGNRIQRKLNTNSAAQIQFHVSHISASIPSKFLEELFTSIDENIAFSRRKDMTYNLMTSTFQGAQLIKKLNNHRVGDTVIVLSALVDPGSYDIELNLIESLYISSIFQKVYKKWKFEIIANIAKKINEVSDVSSLKALPCYQKLSCNGLKNCPRYHNFLDKRRSPIFFKYTDALCLKAKTSDGLCKDGIHCPMSHNLYEVSFHPSQYQVMPCPSGDSSNVCNDKELCRYAHKDSPEMFFTKEWEDLCAIGVEHSINFFTGAIRATFKIPAPSQSNVKVFLIGSSEEVLDLIVNSSDSLLKTFGMSVCKLWKNYSNADSSQILIGKPSEFCKLDCKMLINLKAAVIIDDIKQILQHKLQRDDLSCFFTLISASLNSKTLNKVIVSAAYDATLISSISKLLGIQPRLIESETDFNKYDLYNHHKQIKSTKPNFRGRTEHLSRPVHKRSRSRSKSSERNKRTKSSSSIIDISAKARHLHVDKEQKHLHKRRRSRSRPIERYQSSRSGLDSKSRSTKSPTDGSRYDYDKSQSQMKSRFAKMLVMQNDVSFHLRATNSSLQKRPTSPGQKLHKTSERSSRSQNLSHAKMRTSDFDLQTELLRNRIGPAHFAQYSSDLEMMRNSFEEEYSVYREVSELHPQYDKHYLSFVNVFQDHQAYQNETHRNVLWKSYWESKFEEIKRDHWKLKRQNLTEDFERKVIGVQVTQSSEQRTSHQGEGSSSTLEESLSLLEGVCHKLPFLGLTVKAMVQTSRDFGLNSREAYDVFTDAEAVSLLNLVSEKVRSMCLSTYDESRFVLEKVVNCIPKLLDEARKGPPMVQNTKNNPIDLDRIIKITVGKGSVFALDIIKAALAYEGIKNPSIELVNELFLKVCDAHFSMSQK